ncbi:MAG TPA: glycosyltransferase family 39 protein [Candidatus Acidoferrales bacterium]|nr:glycosyltransferase family 39 protein [Candidatus Acidoferrales bacterium]
MRRRHGRTALFVIGAILAAAGQYCLANNDSVAARLDAALGERGRMLTHCMPGVYPPGVGFAFAVLLAGTALVAFAVGVPTHAPAVTASEPHPLAAPPTLSRSAIGLGGAVVVLAVLTVYLVSRPRPGSGGIVTWIATLILALVGMLVVDRKRGTSFGNPFRWWEWGGLTLLVALDLILVAHDLRDWHWSGTPDEAYFFTFAKAIAEGRNDVFPLSEHGVFGFNPVLSSYYQGAFMKLFGVNVFGWRLSSAAALAFSLPFVYLFARELWSRRAGLIAAVLLGTGQLPVGFAHLGYNNVQVYPVVTGALAVMAWSVRRRSLTGYFVAGCIAGLGFFTYSTAILAGALLVLLLWSLGRRSLRTDPSLEIVALVLGGFLTALPMLVRSGEYVADMFRLAGLGSAPPFNAVAQGSGWLAPVLAKLAHIFTLWMESVLHAPWFPCPSHFEPRPIVDPISGVLATVGLWLGVGATIRRAGATRFLFLGYLLSAFVVGAISPYSCPALTRLLFVAPFTALFAGIALDQVLRYVAGVSRYRPAPWIVGIGLVAAAVASSTAALYNNVYHRNHGCGDGTTSELIRLTQQRPGTYHIVYIQTQDTDMGATDQLFPAYDTEKRLTYLKPYGPGVKAVLEMLTPPFLVTYDLRKREEIDAVEQTLQARFPRVRWQNSASGETWNLRYFAVQGP